MVGGSAQGAPPAPAPAGEFQRLCARVIPTLNDTSTLASALVPYLGRAAPDPSGNSSSSGGNGSGGPLGNRGVPRPALPPPQGNTAPSPRHTSPPHASGGGGGVGGAGGPVPHAQPRDPEPGQGEQLQGGAGKPFAP